MSTARKEALPRPYRILLFLKAPRPGEVKTRLARDLGPERAAAVYRSLAEAQLRRLPKDAEVVVAFAPADAESEMRAWLGHGYRFRAQCEGDLGERLAEAVADAFAAGAGGVTCIGGDCPALDARHLRQANEKLANGADVVFGPSEDGGYTLIALAGPHTGLFEDIPWSSPETLRTSLARAKQLGLRAELLETLYDIDTAKDLERAARDAWRAARGA